MYRKTLFFLFLLFLCGFLFASGWLGRFFFPLPYREAIFLYAQKNQLDPYFVSALVRVESKFHPLATSPRGARGLMQLMPETAQEVAHALGVAHQPEALYEPEYNLELGCWYLASLKKEFGGNLVLTLAAYNGGKERVKNWLASGNWDGSLAEIEKVPYPETKVFIKAVLRNYQVYQLLYAGRRVPTSAPVPK